MQRIDIIDTIGRDRHVENIEGGEFSYKQVLSNITQTHWKLDIRFYDAAKNVAILVETKPRQIDSDKDQLFAYVALEQRLNRNTKIVAILADTSLTNKIRVWKVWRNSIEELVEETVLKSFDEYARLFERQTYNNASAVLQNTNELNELLHTNGIKEGKRSQFVGTCMLALKSDLQYKERTTSEILANIKGKLGEYLQNSVNKAEKIALLSTNVLQDQNVEELEAEHFEKILDFINEKILPYIKDDSTKGQDILSYFFTTFSKYVNRGDKNQAFTPNHIAHFMCKVGGINKNLRVLDPTCGSGTFLVQAMTQILDECDTEAEKNNVKQNQIYGIEYDRDVYGLATTNMLIHSDGNSNIIQASCFDKANWIKEKNIGLVLMNPPYNAQKTVVPRDFSNSWGSSKEDPSKGLYFVRYVADTVGQGRLLTLLPMQCAIKTNTIIANIKTDRQSQQTKYIIAVTKTKLFTITLNNDYKAEIYKDFASSPFMTVNSNKLITLDNLDSDSDNIYLLVKYIYDPKVDPAGPEPQPDKPKDLSSATITIQVLSNKKFIDGYKDNTFRPNEYMTRAEFAKVISSLSSNFIYSDRDKDARVATNTYSDIKDTDWYKEYVGYLTDKNILRGYSANNGTKNIYKGNSYIKRSEVSKILTSMFDIKSNIGYGQIEKNLYDFKNIFEIFQCNKRFLKNQRLKILKCLIKEI